MLRKLWHRLTGAGDPARLRDAPAEWAGLLDSRMPQFSQLPPPERADLLRMMRRFVDEKRFYGSKGLTVTDEMKVTVAAYACLLWLRLPAERPYPRTSEVIIYPSAFGETHEAIGPDGRRYALRDMRLGQAIYRGPILLAWDSVENPSPWRMSRRNVIIHEFAHALDFLDGVIDGTPPLPTNESVEDWASVFASEFEQLRADLATGHATLLDGYGATNPAEFFAVSTECFFEQPLALRRKHPRLYERMRLFFRQDPANWSFIAR